MLTGKQRRHLRALGHPLKPIVQVGKDGIDEGLLAALDQALADHELVKIKIGEGAGLDRKDAADELAQKTQSEVAQILGNTVLLYRADPDDPKIVLPKTKVAAGGKERTGGDEETVDEERVEDGAPRAIGERRLVGPRPAGERERAEVERVLADGRAPGRDQAIAQAPARQRGDPERVDHVGRERVAREGGAVDHQDPVAPAGEFEAESAGPTGNVGDARAGPWLQDLQEELIDRFGEMPPQTQSLMETHKLRLACAPLGLTKIDASENTINLQFVPNPPVDPADIIMLIQKDRNLRLAGQDRLTWKKNSNSLQERVAAIRELLGKLQPAPKK